MEMKCDNKKIKAIKELAGYLVRNPECHKAEMVVTTTDDTNAFSWCLMWAYVIGESHWVGEAFRFSVDKPKNGHPVIKLTRT